LGHGFHGYVSHYQRVLPDIREISDIIPIIIPIYYTYSPIYLFHLDLPDIPESNQNPSMKFSGKGHDFDALLVFSENGFAYILQAPSRLGDGALREVP